MTVDWQATKYIGLTIEWNYTTRKANIHMPGYLKKAFVLFKHQKPDKIQRSLSITKSGVNLVNDEGIRDTLLDLHNYAAMALMLLDEPSPAT